MLGKNINYLRTQANMSRLNLAKLSELDDAWIYRIEQGLAKDPGVHAVNRIAHVLGVTLDDLINKDLTQSK